MQLNNARILLTGATGGLGQELARSWPRPAQSCCSPAATPPAWPRSPPRSGAGTPVCAPTLPAPRALPPLQVRRANSGSTC
jgi:hypothetical protein